MNRIRRIHFPSHPASVTKIDMTSKKIRLTALVEHGG
jgi:hypothetical protein